MPFQDGKWHPPHVPRCQGARAKPSPVSWVPHSPTRTLRPEIKAQAATVPRLFAMATSGSHSWASCCNCSGPGSCRVLTLPLVHDCVLPGQHKAKKKILMAAELLRRIHLGQAGLAQLSSHTVGPRQLSPCHTGPVLAKQTAARGPVLPGLGDVKASPCPVSSLPGK